MGAGGYIDRRVTDHEWYEKQEVLDPTMWRSYQIIKHKGDKVTVIGTGLTEEEADAMLTLTK